MTDPNDEAKRREAWEKIKTQAPGFAEDLKLLTAAFGKPEALKVTLLESGEEIQVGEFYEPPAPVARKPAARHHHPRRGDRYRRY